MFELTSFFQFFGLLFTIYLGIPIGIIISLLASEELLKARKYFSVIIPSLIFLLFINISYVIYLLLSSKILYNIQLVITLFIYSFIMFIILFFMIYFYYKNKKYLLMLYLIFYTSLSIIVFLIKDYNMPLLIISIILFVFSMSISCYSLSFTSFAREEITFIEKKEYQFILKLLLFFIPFVIFGLVFYFLAIENFA